MLDGLTALKAFLGLLIGCAIIFSMVYDSRRGRFKALKYGHDISHKGDFWACKVCREDGDFIHDPNSGLCSVPCPYCTQVEMEADVRRLTRRWWQFWIK